MNATAYRLVVLVIAIAQLVLASVVDKSTVFGLGPVVVTTLGIISAVLTLVANYLPSIFGSEPPQKPGP